MRRSSPNATEPRASKVFRMHGGRLTARPAGPAGRGSVASPPVTPAAPSEADIRERAYRLWEEAGRPAGDGVEFWLRAERELTGRAGG
jgi:hypothetical protein